MNYSVNTSIEHWLRIGATSEDYQNCHVLKSVTASPSNAKILKCRDPAETIGLAGADSKVKTSILHKYSNRNQE
jgi:hypothetical protein